MEVTVIIMKEIFDIAKKFNLASEPIAMQECKIGHINSTYFIDCENGEKFVLQHINTNIFKNPDILMDNIVGVTSHIRKKLEEEGKDPLRGTLKFYCSETGLYYYKDEEGRCWRLYKYVDEVDCFQTADSPELLERVGKAFGHFQMQLADFDASVLYESIPNFHNTVSRFADFEKALSDDLAGRAAGIKDDIKFILDRKDKCSFIMDGIADGRFPLRVTHNDTKLNNIMMDPETGEGRCVIDLDTVMPGSVLADFGDAIRFGASSAAEDETDLDKVYVRLDMFEGFAKGFVEGLEGSLTETEVRALPMGAFMLTFEQSIRFLGDYLNGDTYFRTHYPEHNLDRARNQMKLVADLESKMDEMNRIIEKYI
jgi:hypothetical protein